LFGAPASSGGLFGAAQSPGGGLFSAQASSGGLFGAPQSQGGGLFGAAPSPGGFYSGAASSGGLFGAPQAQGGLFGAPITQLQTQQGLFGAQQQQQQQQRVELSKNGEPLTHGTLFENLPVALQQFVKSVHAKVLQVRQSLIPNSHEALQRLCVVQAWLMDKAGRKGKLPNLPCNNVSEL
jgi:hypothetical protein